MALQLKTTGKLQNVKEVFTIEKEIDHNVDSGFTRETEGLRDILFTQELMLGRLLKLDSSKSPGQDGLHPHLLKMCAHNIAKTLAELFQESFDSGQLPTDWKLANVCPIFEKGSRSTAGN